VADLATLLESGNQYKASAPVTRWFFGGKTAFAAVLHPVDPV
jgi:hypothetical protein